LAELALQWKRLSVQTHNHPLNVGRTKPIHGRANVKQIRMGFDGRELAALWILTTSLGWALVPLTPLQSTFRTYVEIARQVPVYALVGLLLGATSGLGQAMVWKLRGQPAARWWWASALGYALALPLALIGFTLVPSFFTALQGQNPFFLPLTEPGSTTFWPPPQTLALCGGIVGAAQWLALRRLLPRSTLAMALLWVFGAWLSLSLGMALGGLARQIAPGFGWPEIVSGIVGRTTAGAAIGMLTGVLLIGLKREARRLSNRALAPQRED
jgi:hypothetical protein